MIHYSPLWQTMKMKKITTYRLRKDYHISSSTIFRLRKNQPVTTTTINDLCRILDCKIEDVAEYRHNKEDQKL